MLGFVRSSFAFLFLHFRVTRHWWWRKPRQSEWRDFNYDSKLRLTLCLKSKKCHSGWWNGQRVWCHDECFHIQKILSFQFRREKISTLSCDDLFIFREMAPSSLKFCHVCLQISRLHHSLFIYNKREIINFSSSNDAKATDCHRPDGRRSERDISSKFFRKFHSNISPPRKWAWWGYSIIFGEIKEIFNDN